MIGFGPSRLTNDRREKELAEQIDSTSYGLIN